MNKGRLVDILLIITLVLVAFGITYTLLTLNRGQTSPPPAATTPADPPAESAAAPVDSDLPVVPDGLPGDPEGLPVIGGGPADEDGAAADPDAGAEADDPAESEVTADDDADEADEEPAPPRTLAEGELELESVGFSFVTGGAGACGVVLEAWEHVAVSRELLADLGCGAEVQLELADEVGGRTFVNATIGDTMNPSHTMTVNIYVGEDEPAFEYGRTTGILLAP